MSDGAVFETIDGRRDTPVLLLCDHATNIVPQAVGGGHLGISDAEMARHIAYDIGARGLTLALADRLGAPAVLSRFSRLVIDPNRGEDDPTLVMRLYYGTIVPENRRITAEEVARRIRTYHRPYHAAVTAAIDAMLARGVTPVLVAVHSYTPQLRGRGLRPWHVGILWHHDGRLAQPLLARLRAEPDLCIGDNQPYSGQLEGDSMSRHGTGRGLAHALIEMRHDLIADPAAQEAWADRLAPMLQEAAAQALTEESPR